jgi:hypothetical protein
MNSSFMIPLLTVYGKLFDHSDPTSDYIEDIKLPITLIIKVNGSMPRMNFSDAVFGGNLNSFFLPWCFGGSVKKFYHINGYTLSKAES